MADTVDLDGEPRLGAIEVEHIGSDRMLPSKGWASGRAIAEPAHSIASGAERLRRSLLAAARVGGGALIFDVAPSTTLRVVPLPRFAGEDRCGAP